jgi:copper oxidase (laccase) domain-containing protein
MPYLETVNPGAWWDYLTVDPNTTKVDFAIDLKGKIKISPEGRSLFKITPADPTQMIGIDVTKFNQDQLIKAGVLARNIEIMNFCTAEQGRKGKIFSHHLTNEDPQKYPEGRFMAVAQLAA